MNQDKNKNQNGSRANYPLEVPKPRAIIRTEQDGFQEDLALDSMLREMGRSSSDGRGFLDRVKTRKLTGVAAPVHFEEAFVESKEADSFFGLPACLTGANLESTDRSNSYLNAKLFLTIVAAIMLVACGSMWWLFGAATVGDAPFAQKSEFSKTNTAQRNSDVSGRPSTISPDKRGSSEPSANLEPNRPTQAPGEHPSERIVPSDTDRLASDSTRERSAVDLSSNAINDSGVWKLIINFDDQGKAVLVVNEKRIPGRFRASDADMVLSRISHEVARRVHYLSPVLNQTWDGLIELNGPGVSNRLSFEGIDAMQDILVQMREAIAGMDLAELKTKPGIPSIDQIKFWASRDRDIPVVMNAIAITDLVLRSKLSTGYSVKDTDSQRFKNYRLISQAEFNEYLLGGSLRIPGPVDAFLAETSFQDLEPETLKQQLKSSVVEVDMFRSAEEFHYARIEILCRDAGKARDTIVSLIQLKEGWEKWLRKNEGGLASQIKRVRSKLDQTTRSLRQFEEIAQQQAQENPGEAVEPLKKILPSRPDLQGLDLVMGEACHLDESRARTMNAVSTSAGQTLQRFDRFGSRDFSKHGDERLKTIRNLIRKTASSVNASQAIGTLDQMLQIERPELRLELVNALSQTNSDTSCELLTCYAKYDVDPDVRHAATDALRGYPAELYRGKLLEGFLYPWPEVAKHTAEAIVRLNDTESIPTLVSLLNAPDPRTPQPIEDGKFLQRELVGINHMRNCTLCHADSQSSTDQGRGLIPIWNSPMVAEYYQGQLGARIRADITYLRQDFSLVQPVEDAAPWPENQRYDYVVRRTVLDADKAKQISSQLSRQPNEYHRAIAKALRLLTNEDPADDSYESWRKVIPEVPQ